MTDIRWNAVIAQIHFIANESLPIVIVSVLFASVVVILESSFHMRLVIQNDSMVPGFAAMLILRELGSVVTALLVTSRVGAGMAAEVGTMKITEQVEALTMLGIRPVPFLLGPRLIACIISTALLALIANVVCIYGAMIVSQTHLGFTEGIFISGLRRFVHFKDLGLAMVKGAVFGFIIPVVSCYYGFKCEVGAQGVGHATTQAVVVSSILIIVADFFMSFGFSVLFY